MPMRALALLLTLTLTLTACGDENPADPPMEQPPADAPPGEQPAPEPTRLDELAGHASVGAAFSTVTRKLSSTHVSRAMSGSRRRTVTV